MQNTFNWDGFFEAYSKFANSQGMSLATVDISIDKSFEIYLNKVQLELEAGTYDMNKCHLVKLKKFFEIKGIINLSEITQQVVEEFKIYCFNRGNSNATINKECGILLRVMKYMSSLKLYNGDIFDFKKLRENTPETRYIKLDELDKINNYISNLEFQNQVIVLLLIQTGIRRKECTDIEIKNINFENNSIFLSKTKTHKTRYCFFDDDLKASIIKLVSEHDQYLFEKNGAKITPNAVSCVFKRLEKKLDIPKLSTHKLRHSFATYLIKNNVDIRRVQKLMGHTNISTTMRYLHCEEAELKESALISNPLTLIKK